MMKNCFVIPSSMSGGNPPTNTFLEKRSPVSPATAKIAFDSSL